MQSGRPLIVFVPEAALSGEVLAGNPLAYVMPVARFGEEGRASSFGRDGVLEGGVVTPSRMACLSAADGGGARTGPMLSRWAARACWSCARRGGGHGRVTDPELCGRPTDPELRDRPVPSGTCTGPGCDNGFGDDRGLLECEHCVESESSDR